MLPAVKFQVDILPGAARALLRITVPGRASRVSIPIDMSQAQHIIAITKAKATAAEQPLVGWIERALCVEVIGVVLAVSSVKQGGPGYVTALLRMYMDGAVHELEVDLTTAVALAIDLRLPVLFEGLPEEMALEEKEGPWCNAVTRFCSTPIPAAFQDVLEDL